MASPSKEKKPKYAPAVEVIFEITATKRAGGEMLEAAPLLDEAPELEEGHLARLQTELSQPYSTLSLRIKEELERAIAEETRPKMERAIPMPVLEPDFHKKHTVYDVLNLKDTPKDLGNAYMMRGPTVQQAPFMGFKHESTGMQSVTVAGIPLPGKYQPYCSALDHPYGREGPHVENPAGTRLPQPLGTRSFQSVRHVPDADLHKRQEEERQKQEAERQPTSIEPSQTLAEASYLQFEDTLLLNPDASGHQVHFAEN